MKGLVSEITNFSTRDGPGIRTSVFLKGCPLRCRWCSNPETFEQKKHLFYIPSKCRRCGRCEAICPRQAISSRYPYPSRVNRKKCDLCMKCVSACLYDAFQISGKEYTSEELVAIIKKDKIFYGQDGGVTISGGEALSQGEFVREVFQACKEDGISTVLDTSAYGDTALLERILDYTDLVLLDLKHMDSSEHKKWTGVPNELILKNARIIAARRETRISLPLVAGVNDGPDNLKALAEFALDNRIHHIDMNPLHFLGAGKYKYLGLRSPYHGFRQMEKDEIQQVKDLLETYGLCVGIGRMM